MLGATLITVGYTLAIGGGFVLFVNAPPDVGGTHALMIPRVSGDEDWTAQEFSNIGSRQFWNRIGFALLTAGSCLQLAGYWSDRISLSN